MTTYKEIRGTNIEAVASDPSNPVEGQVWYNTTTNVVKGLINNIGSWATSGNLNTARGGAGTQTAALTFGGQMSPGPPTGLHDQTETWNGTNWTEVNDLNTARAGLAGAGINNTAVLAFGGDAPAPPTATVAVTELWNGTNWTETTDLNTAREQLTGTGTSTSALAFGGKASPGALTEIWNGSNWTEVNDLGTARYALGGSGITNTAVLAFGGNKQGDAGNVAFTESWNGTNWTEIADLNVQRYQLTGCGTSVSALASGGRAGNTASASTEEFDSGPATVTFGIS